ncbi:serine acetyltransferase [Paracoccus caeni]|uniref:Serine acetyltransferase n=1 Tax=Paracoccus caeni TaxID=657651 RepID=A0A934SJ87_9RHOB|nr:serine acetyltransferase [Paracoccus caeni]MBK4218111.1 serine acetyltransferase [Paracoccus caeni]
MLNADRDRKLLRAMARYQRYRDRRDPLSRLKCLSGKLGHLIWSLLGASDISRDAKIDPGTRMPHPSGIVIHAGVVVEPGCLIMQQVTLGQLANGGVPYLERDVYIGAGAKVLGPVRIGAGARIGANAVVLEDVPAGATAVGIPARIVGHGKEQGESGL